MRVLDPEIGSRFGRLVVTGVAEPRKGYRYFNVVCDCGVTKGVAKSSLTGGKTTSCGCLHKERTSQVNKSHEQCGTPAYRTWQSMKKRCLNPKHLQFKDYGGRGIKVCERWLSFENFFEDMGEPPTDYSLDRINCNGSYEPGNCRWTDARTQAENRRNSTRYIAHGETLTIRQASEKYGIDRGALEKRVYRYGLTLEAAIALPPGGHRGLPIANKRTDGFLLYGDSK